MSTHSSVDMLDDVESDDYDFEEESDNEDLRLAQEEWDESMQQLQLVVSVVAMPFLGKWLGRRWSQWGI